MISNIIQKNLAMLSYRFMDGYAFLPKSIMFEVTYRCNLRCKMCGYYGEKGTRPNLKELTLLEIEKIVNDVQNFSPFITVTGGEPFIRNDIIQIFDIFKEKKLKFGILTNGTMIDEKIAEKVADLDPQYINISIDGPERIHEEVRGPKTFERAINGIRLLKNNNYSKITINCVVSKINFDHLEELVNMANNLDVNLQFQHLQFTDQKMDDKHKKMIKEYFNFNNEDRTSGICNSLYDFDVNKLVEQIKKIKNLENKNRINFLPNLNLKEIEKYYLSLCDYTHSQYCLYPWKEARINPKGELSYCILEPIAGCLLNSPFKEIWNNDNMLHFRRTLKKEKLFPNCARCCKI